MDLISQLLTLDEFQKKPPVLLDIGASGSIHPVWKKIAGHSVCIGFDADHRDLDLITNNESGFKKLYLTNKIVAEKEGKNKFYLTKSPHCSSALLPNHDRLRDWSFSELFQVEKVVELETVSLPAILEKFSLNYIDWFKTDSQGTDLRLFQSLGPNKISNLIVAEFEPGIMDSYIKEDKMHTVMSFMENYPFWLSDLVIKGPQRISQANLKDNFANIEQRFFSCLQKSTAFWGEMTYFNTFERQEMLQKRNILLGWIFSSLIRQHSFALELAIVGKENYDDPIFDDLKSESVRLIKRNRWKLPLYLTKKLYQKLIH